MDVWMYWDVLCFALVSCMVVYVCGIIYVWDMRHVVLMLNRNVLCSVQFKRLWIFVYAVS